MFSVKAPRYATWRRALGEAGPAITRFLDSGVTELGPKLGPMLWQLPPTRTFDATAVDAAAEPEGYPAAALDVWRTRLRSWHAAGWDCFVYFIAGDKVHAPSAAAAMLRRLDTAHR